MTDRIIAGIAADGSVAFAPEQPAAESIVERAAKATFAQTQEEGQFVNEPWESPALAKVRELFRKRARAVLEAIREPSEGMNADGMAVSGLDGETNQHVWQAMIDAALEEG